MGHPIYIGWPKVDLKEMISFPPCKINLGLNIIRKRPDGYHNLSTCFYPVQWTDVLEIIPASITSFTSSGSPIPGKAEDNLCLKAYHVLKQDFDIDPVHIHLHKIIPTGAGLGGGSADAAHSLRLLNEIFELALTNERLMQYAALLGSDCAFFIQDKPMLGSERGEVLTPASVNFDKKFIVLIKPPIHVSTAEAYAGVKPALPEMEIANILVKPVSEWKHVLKNDFEVSVFDRFHRIKTIKEYLYAQGATYASMSGSGSSVFGIFEGEIQIDKIYSDCETWAGYL